MDKIIKEFRKWYKSYYQREITTPDDLLEDDSFSFVGWKACWESKEEEMKRLKEAIGEARNYTTPMGSSMTDWYNHIIEILEKALEAENGNN